MTIEKRKNLLTMAVALDQVAPEKAVEVLNFDTLDQKELGWIISDSMAGVFVHKDTGVPLQLSEETMKVVLRKYALRKIGEFEQKPGDEPKLDDENGE